MTEEGALFCACNDTDESNNSGALRVHAIAMPKLGGYSSALTAIDVFSTYAWVKPVRAYGCSIGSLLCGDSDAGGAVRAGADG